MSSHTMPEGWHHVSPESARRLLDELQRELPPGHRLFGVALVALARCGANDDVLFRFVDEPERFVIVHLTWRHTPEVDPRWPSIELDGTFDQFLAYATSA